MNRKVLLAILKVRYYYGRKKKSINNDLIISKRTRFERWNARTIINSIARFYSILLVDYLSFNNSVRNSALAVTLFVCCVPISIPRVDKSDGLIIYFIIWLK